MCRCRSTSTGKCVGVGVRVRQVCRCRGLVPGSTDKCVGVGGWYQGVRQVCRCRGLGHSANATNRCRLPYQDLQLNSQALYLKLSGNLHGVCCAARVRTHHARDLLAKPPDAVLELLPPLNIVVIEVDAGFEVASECRADQARRMVRTLVCQRLLPLPLSAPPHGCTQQHAHQHARGLCCTALSTATVPPC